MSGLWVTLIPLIVGSALVPIQIIITTLLLRSSSGRITAVALVAGMTIVRLGQGLVFGLILGSPEESGSTSDGPRDAFSLLFLVLAIVFYVSAGRQLASHPDEDAPPPKWMAMIEGITPGRAFLMGAGLVLASAKFWVFTLGALAAIGDAALSPGASVTTFVLFVALAESVVLAIVAVAYAIPDRATAILDRFTAFLETYNRFIMIGLGLVFGTWFLAKALGGLGII